VTELTSAVANARPAALLRSQYPAFDYRSPRVGVRMSRDGVADRCMQRLFVGKSFGRR